MDKLRKELMPILGNKIPTPPNPNALQVFWSLKLNIGGKRKKFTAKTEEALYKKILDYYSSESVTLNDYFVEWLSDDKTIAESTKKRKEQRWNKFFKNTIGMLNVSKLSFGLIESSLSQFIEKNPTTRKDLQEALSPLRYLCRKAVREGLLQADPMPFVQIDWSKCKRSKAQNERPEDRVFQLDEMEKVIAECNKMIARHNNRCSAYYGIKMLRLTGLRVGELVALRFADFDPNELILHVHAREIPSGGKRVVVEGNKGTHVNDTEVVYRDIPITADVIALLDEIRAFNALNGFLEDDFVFVGKNGRSTIKAVENALWKACELAGLEKKKSPHDIRRTVATILFRKGTNLKQIQYFLGHSDVETTRNYIYDDTVTTSYYNSIRENIK